MQNDASAVIQGQCPACDIDPFVRNAYWTGKLMLARDFIDEQSYVVEKLRHHNQQLHGFGVACGLKVVQHENPSCQSRYVYVEPGTAVDCCGHDIVVKHRDILDLYAQPEIQALQAAVAAGTDTSPTHKLQICIRYRECPTEPIPVLYDDCADESRCAPNRILESYALGVILDAPPTQGGSTPPSCSTIWTDSIEGCPHCDLPDCLVLATILDYAPGNAVLDKLPSPPPSGASAIDNVLERVILPSTQVIVDVVNCIMGTGPTTTPPSALTGIKALSWSHGGTFQKLASITKDPPTSLAQGLVVQFTGKVSIDAALVDSHVFEVLRAVQTTSGGIPIRTWSSINNSMKDIPQIIPVEVTSPPGQIITAATQLQAGLKWTDAVAFLWPGDPTLVARLDLWVRLRCDFLVDMAGRAVSGAYLRGSLPTGQFTPIEGGLFESWSTYDT